MKSNDRRREVHHNDRTTPGRARKSLLALGSAAVLAVYSAGFVRTRAAAERFAADAAERRPAPLRSPQPDFTGQVASAVPQPDDSARLTSSPSAATPEHRSDATQADSNLERIRKAAATRATSFSTPQSQASAVAESIAKPRASDSTPTPTATATPVQVVDSTTTTNSQTADSAATDTAAAPAAWKDGVYTGWGTSRHGDIQASVEISGGRIVSASITQCLTRYSCSWIDALPPQVVSRQSPEVDYISGATQSTNAFYYAVVDALSKAK